MNIVFYLTLIRKYFKQNELQDKTKRLKTYTGLVKNMLMINGEKVVKIILTLK